jgi:hypothetical protein
MSETLSSFKSGEHGAWTARRAYLVPASATATVYIASGFLPR